MYVKLYQKNIPARTNTEAATSMYDITIAPTNISNIINSHQSQVWDSNPNLTPTTRGGGAKAHTLHARCLSTSPPFLTSLVHWNYEH